MKIKQLFLENISRYTSNFKLQEGLWKEIYSHYTETGRYYHNLSHLENLIAQLEEVKGYIQDWEIILFAAFYHDIVYDPLSDKNEEESAELARERLAELGVSSERTEKCSSIILSTKSHQKAADKDINYFTDADLSILGAPWEVFLNYSKQVRQEYAVFADSVYKTGRRKVIVHFLNKSRIFNTEYHTTIQSNKME